VSAAVAGAISKTRFAPRPVGALWRRRVRDHHARRPIAQGRESSAERLRDVLARPGCRTARRRFPPFVTLSIGIATQVPR